MNNSVLKALDLMSAFTPERPRKSVAELSQELQIPKSTVHRLLRTLQARGFIEQVRREEYSLGTRLLALAQSARVNVEVRDRTATVARALAEATGESVYVAILEDASVFYIYAVETSRRLRARTAVGDHAPLYCTSIGKAILSALPQSTVDGLLNRQSFESYTPNTFVNPELVNDDLILSRQRGYSIDNQEHEVGVFCIGAAFRDSSGNVIGAISVSGNDPEISDRRLPELSTQLVDSAAQISVQLGYVAARRSMI